MKNRQLNLPSLRNALDENAMPETEKWGKIMLINPPSFVRRERYDNINHPHLGLGLLAAYLRQQGFACQPIDAKFERMDLQEVANAIKKHSPRLVGITAMTHEVNQAVLAWNRWDPTRFYYYRVALLPG